MQTLISGILLVLMLLFSSAISGAAIYLLFGPPVWIAVIIFLIISLLAFLSWCVCAMNKTEEW